MADLHGIEIKRNRAEAHLQAIKQMVDAYTAPPYAVRVEPHSDIGRYVIYSDDRRVLPVDDLAACIGDCVHNMRSVFDYIAWELAGADLRDHDTMFPICETEEAWKKRRWRTKKVEPAPARTAIDGYQPYKAGNIRNARMTALWLIEHLDIADKHKLLTVTSPTLDEIFIEPIDQPPGDYKTRFQVPPLNAAPEFGTVIAVAEITPPTPGMQVKARYTPQVMFRDDGEMPPVMEVKQNLEVMLRSVDQVIAAFKPFFA